MSPDSLTTKQCAHAGRSIDRVETAIVQDGSVVSSQFID